MNFLQQIMIKKNRSKRPFICSNFVHLHRENKHHLNTEKHAYNRPNPSRIGSAE